MAATPAVTVSVYSPLGPGREVLGISGRLLSPLHSEIARRVLGGVPVTDLDGTDPAARHAVRTALLAGDGTRLRALHALAGGDAGQVDVASVIALFEQRLWRNVGIIDQLDQIAWILNGHRPDDIPGLRLTAHSVGVLIRDDHNAGGSSSPVSSSSSVSVLPKRWSRLPGSKRHELMNRSTSPVLSRITRPNR